MLNEFDDPTPEFRSPREAQDAYDHLQQQINVLTKLCGVLAGRLADEIGMDKVDLVAGLKDVVSVIPDQHQATAARTESILRSAVHGSKHPWGANPEPE